LETYLSTIFVSVPAITRKPTSTDIATWYTLTVQV
jgi:hypothetical protein